MSSLYAWLWNSITSTGCIFWWHHVTNCHQFYWHLIKVSHKHLCGIPPSRVHPSLPDECCSRLFSNVSNKIVYSKDEADLENQFQINWSQIGGNLCGKILFRANFLFCSIMWRKRIQSSKAVNENQQKINGKKSGADERKYVSFLH